MKIRFLFSSFATILLGVLFIVFQGGVFDLMIKVIAALIALYGLIDFLKLHWVVGAIKVLLGVAVWFVGWKFLTVALYIVAALLIVYGFLGLFKALRRRRSAPLKLLSVLSPILCIAVGLFLIFGQGVVLSWVFIATGVALIVSGLFSLVR